jgi:chromosome segregation ATPase
VLLALLHEAAATQRVADLQAAIGALTQQRTEAEALRAGAEAAYNGAQTAYIEAKVRLQQLDVVRRRDALQAQIDRLTTEDGVIRQRWHTLRDALRNEAHTLQPFANVAPFALAERAAVETLLQLIANLTAAAPPPALAMALDAAVPALPTLCSNSLRSKV